MKDDLTIDVDGSPLGFIAWYNHKTRNCMVRMVQPLAKDVKFGVQRVEMIAVYYGLLDNLESFLRVRDLKSRKICIDVRSDSKSTVEQLQGLSKIRDRKLLRITKTIMKLLSRLKLQIEFNHVERNKNVAGYMLELQRGKRYSTSQDIHSMGIVPRTII
ncbi:MAG TPA: reverse transcriptase-like protein [Nitrososphaeraceae archaeon]